MKMTTEIKKRRWSYLLGGIVLLALVIFLLTYRSVSVEVDAAELDNEVSTVTENETDVIEFDMNADTISEATYTDENGEEGTATITPDFDNPLLRASSPINSGTRTYTITYQDSVCKSTFKISCKKVGTTGDILSAYGLTYKTFINKVDSASVKKVSTKKAQANFRFSNIVMSWTGYYGVKVSGSKLVGFHD
ncbi:DUF5626 family protein [Listeria booriae]|uniref:DUF5626 family protein n=2 Tax=Listeria booriae TaxID=1552123 RepID=A0A841Y367_9LIST|nr:DUF5626 family protein [Listeria booriae]MBC1212473.1 DUF5626 family protein [Listeria booriae]MBC1235475.1 DUF5626 family protein [Listeria booriae]MBC1248187.1 DUF5626 family protein [Listeria booriae]MBC1274307.1 DUF5626 family protein [Listeria booriae]MBC1287291.1 DUF5626 family protein [Listeria booriae]